MCGHRLEARTQPCQGWNEDSSSSGRSNTCAVSKRGNALGCKPRYGQFDSDTALHGHVAEWEGASPAN